MTHMKKLYLFRHGQTDWNLQERFQGHLDIPLNSTGKTQARQIVPALIQWGIEVILSSDLLRARETAEIIAESMGIPVFQDLGLREAHLGGAQGMTKLEMEKKFGKGLLQRWRSSKVQDADISFPDGESGSIVYERVAQSIRLFILNHPNYTRIGVATHGGVIRRVMERLMPAGSPPIPIPNAVIYSMHYDVTTTKFYLT